MRAITDMRWILAPHVPRFKSREALYYCSARTTHGPTPDTQDRHLIGIRDEDGGPEWGHRGFADAPIN